MSFNKLQSQYYFAFGSNMSLTQMAERCPGSTFIGRATLRGHRWQINQRHVANIVKVAENGSEVSQEQLDFVEGLVFSITDKDRRTLDRKEGIKLGIYERVVLNVLLERHADFADKKTAFIRDRLQDNFDATGSSASGEEGPIDEPQQKHLTTSEISNMDMNAGKSQIKQPDLPSTTMGKSKTEEVKAITYLSTKYADNGLIRKEYVQRMEAAISDAVKLGVSESFVQKYLEPYVHGDIHQPEEEIREKPSTSAPSVPNGRPDSQEPGAKSTKILNSIAGQIRHPIQASEKLNQEIRGGLKKKKSPGSIAKKQFSRDEDGSNGEGPKGKVNPRSGDSGQVACEEQSKKGEGISSSMARSAKSENLAKGNQKC